MAKKIVFLPVILVFVFMVFSVCQAGMLNPSQTGITKNSISEVSGAAGYDPSTNEYSLAIFLGTAVKGFLSLLGVIFIILTLYGGYNWMTAGGDESKVETAKKTIQRAIIGLVIIVSTYGIWAFLFTRLF